MYNRTTFQSYAQTRVQALMLHGRKTTASHYNVAIKKFTEVIGCVAMKDLSSKHIMKFDEYIRASGVCDNTAMFYLRTLKAIYNNAVKNDFIKDKEPFKYVRCGVAKTKKRAITEKQLTYIYHMELDEKHLAFARDMFILSFLLRGMAPIDMQRLDKSNIIDGKVLVYRRSKTHKELAIELTDKAKKIIGKYEVKGKARLLPMSDYYIMRVNSWLKQIGKKAGVLFPLTLYCARHTWASLSRSHNVPISVISSGMGHSNEQITQVYLSEIETSIVDKYNRKLIDSVFN